MAITLTKPAVDEVRRIMESQKLEEGTFVRMGVSGGGCAGLQYSLNFDDQYDSKSDVRYDHDDVALVTTKKFALHLDGTTIDFQDGPMGRGFAINNPNYVSGGGCPGCGG